ncbi:Uncharacterized protein TPAR_08608 [Tolypocladium paradoxum]|uniref:Cyclin N-terminal domain-containing protein n=1 Tax=Tolypocladium paradoxum TaxID=94208 RepID=A0A2S4KLX0_9HYPO|nr:Uncharacterized protein TPAR_08608 [Tolypocladium paradoxum]
MRRGNKPDAVGRSAQVNTNFDDDDAQAYFTYRPLSNLPTPPPTYKDTSAAQSPALVTSLDDGEPLMAKFRGPAIHLVNLIPSSASLATASVPLAQAILSRADLPIETVALAVCILDSLGSKFARAWRLCCPLLPSATLTPVSKRHTLPPTPLLYQAQQRQMLHIDSVKPEIIILAALVIAVKFTEDPQQQTHFYCVEWGKGLWSHDQLNATERCIMESLDYRIMPLCDEDCLADAMVDMQLAGQQRDLNVCEPTPPDSVSNSDDDVFVPCHSRSKTMIPTSATLGLGLTLAPLDTPATETARLTTPQLAASEHNYFS